MSTQAEFTRRCWLGYYDTFDIYNYCVYSEELKHCDLVIDILKKIVLAAYLLKLTKLSANQQTKN